MPGRCPLADLNELARLLGLRRSEIGFTDNEWEQFNIYIEAFQLFMEREAKYNSLWMQYGAVDSYQHMRSKVARTQFLLEGFSEDQDDPLDLINYTAFFLRNLRAGRIHSQTETDPDTQAVAIALEDIKAGETVLVDFETGRLRRA
jgi:hypothetical protein